MPKRATSLLAVFALIFGLISGGATAQAAAPNYVEGNDPAAVLFNPMKISWVEINRVLGGPALTRDYLDSPTFRPANIKITLSGTDKYTTLMNVGVRIKGSFTRRFEKFSVKISFNQFVKGQNYLGLKSMTLNAMMQDPSFIHETTSYKLYRSLGIPAPRNGFSKLRIDGAYMGLYLNLETVDSVMLKHWVSSTKHLYTGASQCDLLPYNQCLQPVIGNTNRADLTAVTKLDSLHGAAWWEAFKNLANVSEVQTLMATEIFLSNWDAYTGQWHNNYFIQFNKRGHFLLLPWGTDQTFPQESFHQLNWDGSKPVGMPASATLGTLFVHCVEFTPCYNQLLRAGNRISETVNKIHLIDYSNNVGNMILASNALHYDLSGANYASARLSQDWVRTFLNNRQKILSKFLASRSPIPLGVQLSAHIHAGQLVKPTIERSWESQVAIAYQWYLDGKPIAHENHKNYRARPRDVGHRLKLQITLSRVGVQATHYFSRTRTVKR